jgi:hypothetical protein
MQMRDHANKDWLKRKPRMSKLNWVLLVSSVVVWSYVLFLIDQEIFK